MTAQIHEMPMKSTEPPFYRFRIFQGKETSDGKTERTKTIGMAYQKDGFDYYTVRLWTFVNERYYLVPNRKDATKFFLMTREPNPRANPKKKYFWNIVGNASVDSVQGHMQIEFDILEKAFFMNIFPESHAKSSVLPEPEAFEEAA